MGVCKCKDSKNYVAAFHVGGVRYRESTGTSNKKAAFLYENEMRDRVLQQVKHGRRTMAVEEACERYLLEELLPRQPKRETATKSVHNLKLIREFFGNVDLEQVTTARVSDWKSAMLRAGHRGS